MNHMNQNRFWNNLAERWRIKSKNNLPQTDTKIIEIDPEELDNIDGEINAILGDLDIEI